MSRTIFLVSLLTLYSSEVAERKLQISGSDFKFEVLPDQAILLRLH